MKKGQSIAIGILVLLVVALICSSVVIFLTSSGKVTSKISDARVLEKFYLKKNLAEFYLEKAGETALKKAYANPDEGFDEYAGEKFVSNFKTEFADYKFEEDYLINLQNQIRDDDFTAVLDGTRVNLEIKKFVLEESYESFNAKYSTRIFLRIK